MRLEQVLDYIDRKKPDVVMEIGTWNGLMARTMLKYGAKKYIGFDLFEDGSEELDEIENNAKKRVTKKEVEETLKDYEFELIAGNTRETLREYIKDREPFVDVCLVDGGHSYHTIKSDLLNVLQIMKDTGTVFLDDYYFNCPTPGTGAQTVMAEMNIPYTVLPKVDKCRDGSLIKVVQIDMRNVPRPSKWDEKKMEKKEQWTFDPVAA